MAELVMFFEDSSLQRQVFRCPEMPEAPRGSLFHEGLDWGKIELRKTGTGVQFYNTVLMETSLAVQILVQETLEIAFQVMESEIRGFQVFKTVEFKDVSLERIAGGFRVGIERNGKELACSFSPSEVQKLVG